MKTFLSSNKSKGYWKLLKEEVDHWDNRLKRKITNLYFKSIVAYKNQTLKEIQITNSLKKVKNKVNLSFKIKLQEKPIKKSLLRPYKEAQDIHQDHHIFHKTLSIPDLQNSLLLKKDDWLKIKI